MYAFDVIYLVDILTMVCYKAISWEEAKQIHKPRHSVIIVLELLSCVPIGVIYLAVTTKMDSIYYGIRLRYAFRCIRLYLYLVTVKKNVGNDPLFTVFLEVGVLLSLFVLIITMIMYILMINAGYTNTFYGVAYYSMTQVSGVGVSLRNVTPHGAVVPLLLCTFILYLSMIYYISCFISALMQKLKPLFVYINSLQKIMDTICIWRYRSVQMYNTVSTIIRESR